MPTLLLVDVEFRGIPGNVGIRYEDNGVDAKSLDYARLSAVLVEAVKAQQAQIKQQQGQIDTLQRQVEALQAH